MANEQQANPDNQHNVPGQEGQALQEPDPSRVAGGTEVGTPVGDPNPQDSVPRPEPATAEVDTAAGDHMRFTQGG